MLTRGETRLFTGVVASVQLSRKLCNTVRVTISVQLTWKLCNSVRVTISVQLSRKLCNSVRVTISVQLTRKLRNTVIVTICYYVAIFPTDLTLTGSEFHRVGAATEKFGTKSRIELDDRRCLGCLAGVSNEYKYAGCLDESA